MRIVRTDISNLANDVVKRLAGHLDLIMVALQKAAKHDAAEELRMLRLTGDFRDEKKTSRQR